MEALNPDLSGKLLIAMPGMADPRFDHAVIFICAHSDEGAMGLIVNKPATEVRFSDLLEQLEIASDPGIRDIRVHIGGPVEESRGFVLHTTDYSSDQGTLQVDEGTAMTATLDVLEDIAHGRGPKSSLLALGYAAGGRVSSRTSWRRTAGSSARRSTRWSSAAPTSTSGPPRSKGSA